MRAALGPAIAFVLVLAAGVSAEPDRSRLGRDHPLAGRIVDPAEGRAIDEPELVRRLSARRFVILGEKHDNPDHHRLQARVVGALVETGRRPGVAFEMLTPDIGPELERVLAGASPTPQQVREAVRWDESGWPEWDLYAPIFEVALRAELPIAAAGLERARVEAIGRDGLDALDPDLRALLGLDAPPPPGRRRALADAIREAHCGYVPQEALPNMIAVQRARDAHLARSLLELERRPDTDGAVLIAGAEHARRDRGAPAHLTAWTDADSIASLAFLEVRSGWTDPRRDLADRFEGPVPFDLVWLTPRLDDEDPCEKFRHELERMGREE